MTHLPDEMIVLLGALAPLFSARVWKYAQLLMMGTLLVFFFCVLAQYEAANKAAGRRQKTSVDWVRQMIVAEYLGNCTADGEFVLIPHEGFESLLDRLCYVA